MKLKHMEKIGPASKFFYVESDWLVFRHMYYEHWRQFIHIRTMLHRNILVIFIYRERNSEISELDSTVEVANPAVCFVSLSPRLMALGNRLHGNRPPVFR
jgi:hypothetical protein